MRKSLVQGVVLSLLLAAPAWCQNTQLDFVLFNRTNVNIKKIYVAPSNVSDWQEDLLQGRMLLTGGDVTIEFHPTAQAKLWDLRVEDAEGEFLEFEDIDLSQAENVILNADLTATLK